MRTYEGTGMSESLTPSGGLVVNPLFTALIPNEGPKGVGLNFDFSVIGFMAGGLSTGGGRRADFRRASTVRG